MSFLVCFIMYCVPCVYFMQLKLNYDTRDIIFLQNVVVFLFISYHPFIMSKPTQKFPSNTSHRTKKSRLFFSMLISLAAHALYINNIMRNIWLLLFLEALKSWLSLSLTQLLVYKSFFGAWRQRWYLIMMGRILRERIDDYLWAMDNDFYVYSVNKANAQTRWNFSYLFWKLKIASPVMSTPTDV